MVAALDQMDQIITGAVNDEQAWRDLAAFVEQATKITEREWKRMIRNRQVASVEQVRAIFLSVADAIMLYVPDNETRRKIADHLDRLQVAGPISV